YGPRVLGAPRYPLVLPPGTPLPRPAPPIVLTELASAPEDMAAPLDVAPHATLALSGGADGLADLGVDDFIAGMNAINLVDEAALLAAPDVVVQPEAPPV